MLGLAFVIAAFSMSYAIEKRLDRLGAFESYNIIFQADANSRIMSFSYGFSYNHGGRNLAHPNLTNFINPVVRIAAKLLHATGIKDGDIKETRRWVGLLVVPVTSALKTAVVFVIFAWLGFSLLQVSLVTALGIISFSQVIYGSVPDHFALSGFGIALSYLLAVDLMRQGGRVRWWLWVAAGTLVMGLTITNIVIVATLFWTALLAVGRKTSSATMASLILIAAASGVTLVSAVTMNKVFEQRYQLTAETLTQSQTWVERFVRQDTVARLVRFTSSIANTVVPPSPKIVDNQARMKGDKYSYYFTFEGTPNVFSTTPPLGLFLLALLLAGSARLLRAGDPMHSLGVASLLILAYNAIFHSVWGSGLFLYSQHWHLSILLLVSGVMLGDRRRSLWGTAAIAVMLIVATFNSAVRLNEVFETLAATM